jgi:hypothetical protein
VDERSSEGTYEERLAVVLRGYRYDSIVVKELVRRMLSLTTGLDLKKL